MNGIEPERRAAMLWGQISKMVGLGASLQPTWPRCFPEAQISIIFDLVS